MVSHRIIKKPLLTEKSTFTGDEFKRYMFLVDPHATKNDSPNAMPSHSSEDFMTAALIDSSSIAAPIRARLRSRWSCCRSPWVSLR